MKMKLKQALIKILGSLPRQVTITGTTTSSGALLIPSAYQNKPLMGMFRNGAPATMIYRRDASYLMVGAIGSGWTFAPYANQDVTITAWTIG